MRRNEGINILDFDMYSSRISFFSNNREKIGSYFGLFLTIVYLLISMTLIIIYSIDAVQRKEMRVYDSTVYSEGTPSINIDSNLINFAFGIEDRISSNRYIDPSIYYPEILYLERVKVSSGEFQTVNRQELNYSKCTKNHFGKNYHNLLVENELNNSYCLDDFNLTLAGGYKYDKMNYIRIKIIPCINSTKNNFTCKPKNVIDEYLTGTYISILFQDIGLNPSNYSVPVIPYLQDLYTTIDKHIFKDFILNFRINEIQTDTGLFYEKIQKKKYLQFLDNEQSFYFRSDEEFESGKQMCVIQIRLNDVIHLQKRSYKKLPESFSIIGGYMQILSTVFTFISLLANKLNLEVKIMNDLFNFNMKENKLTIKVRTLKDLAVIKNKDYIKNSLARKSIFYHKLKKQSQNSSFNNSFSKNFLIGNKSNQNIPSLKILSKTNMLSIGDKNSKNNNDITVIKSKNIVDNSKLITNSFRNNPIYLRPFHVSSKSNKNILNNNKNNININLKVNIIDYYCMAKICKRNKQIELFDLGINLYRKRMDIINVFTILLMSEKIMLKLERRNILGLNNDFENTPSSVIKISQKQIEL